MSAHSPPATPAPLRITFVCLGNICRSPTAHGVLREKLVAAGLAGRVEVDSAGTHGHWHAGRPPDERAQAHARRRGYDLSDLRARALTQADFATSDLILVMDWENLALAEHDAPPEHRRKVRRLTEFCRRHDSPVVPDPYYGGADGFERVLDLIEDACDGLIEHLRQRLASQSAAGARPGLQ